MSLSNKTEKIKKFEHRHWEGLRFLELTTDIPVSPVVRLRCESFFHSQTVNCEI